MNQLPENHVPDNFDKVCKTISEDQWQHNRKKYKREQRIVALLIAVPVVLVVCSALAGIRMWLLH